MKRIIKILLFILLIVLNLSFSATIIKCVGTNNTAELSEVLSNEKDGEVKIEGRFLLEYAVVDENDKSFYYVPVVSQNWNDSQSVAVIAEFPTKDFESLRLAIENNSAMGIVRKHLLDKCLNKKIIDQFEQMNIKIDDKNCTLIEINEQNNSNIIWLLIVDVLIIIFLVILGVKFRKV